MAADPPPSACCCHCCFLLIMCSACGSKHKGPREYIEKYTSLAETQPQLSKNWLCKLPSRRHKQGCSNSCTSFRCCWQTKVAVPGCTSSTASGWQRCKLSGAAMSGALAAGLAQPGACQHACARLLLLGAYETGETPQLPCSPSHTHSRCYAPSQKRI